MPSFGLGVCEDNAGIFKIRSGDYKGKQKNCVWVSQNINGRCEIIEAAKNCPVACGGCNTNAEVPLADARSKITARVVRDVNADADEEGSFMLNSRNLQLSEPSALPVSEPSALPSNKPSSLPTSKPSSLPSADPTSLPSAQPSSFPSNKPSTLPTSKPSSLPSSSPSFVPTATASVLPTVQTTISAQPSDYPSITPSATPTITLSMKPSLVPTALIGCKAQAFSEATYYVLITNICVKLEMFNGGKLSVQLNNFVCDAATYIQQSTYSDFLSITQNRAIFGLHNGAGLTGEVSFVDDSNVVGMASSLDSYDGSNFAITLTFNSCNCPAEFFSSTHYVLVSDICLRIQSFTGGTLSAHQGNLVCDASTFIEQAVYSDFSSNAGNRAIYTAAAGGGFSGELLFKEDSTVSGMVSNLDSFDGSVFALSLTFPSCYFN